MGGDGVVELTLEELEAAREAVSALDERDRDRLVRLTREDDFNEE